MENNILDELEKLHNLKEKGIITEEEFLKAKEKILKSDKIDGLPTKNEKLKLCKSCKKEIDINAKVCPNCGRDDRPIGEKNPAIGCLGIIILIIGVMMIISSIGRTIFYQAERAVNSNASIEQFSLISSEGSQSGGFSYYVSGEILNNTNKKYSYVQANFNLYNSEGDKIGTALCNTNYLEPYSTWKFEAIGLPTNSEKVASYKLMEITGF